MVMQSPQNQVYDGIHNMGQMGVPGSTTDLGVRAVSRARTIYVDNENGMATDANDGTNPLAPKLTIAGGVAATLLANGGQSGDQILVAASDTDYNESVSLLSDTLYASYVRLVGLGSSKYNPVWGSGAADEPCLVMGAQGWSVEGFHFHIPTAAAAVVCAYNVAPYALAESDRTMIMNNYFYGYTTGLYGIDLYGAPPNIEIRNNMFGFIQNAGNTACAIVSTSTAWADAYRTQIVDNWFHECDNFINASLNVGLIKGNTLSTMGTYDAVLKIDLRGGTLGENTVVGNFLGGDYSNVGGYYANAANPGFWGGNIAEDVFEAEVADNGYTIAPPAA